MRCTVTNMVNFRLYHFILKQSLGLAAAKLKLESGDTISSEGTYQNKQLEPAKVSTCCNSHVNGTLTWLETPTSRL
ncbi:hypothetical protein PAXRUDRAFT_507801 [Paxillus rubicundulus Ve08.2h10]|uniref:Uncharacterized protein n=1 Tax=Paxillus rubicundulus Ve08.2h10 TaxID=930991 RepID=A0A0D0DVK8_9AGAM|nr:hypothetical protein PAXRUDRAFT_507801 [Paxillus rubicundulus Ve08.2h10]